MKNLVNKIGTISFEQQLKMHKKASREAEFMNGEGFKSKHKTHKDKKKEANKKACRNFKF